LRSLPFFFHCQCLQNVFTRIFGAIR